MTEFRSASLRNRLTRIRTRAPWKVTVPRTNSKATRTPTGALDANGLPKDRVAIAEDVIGANVDQTQG